jgi:hypothetical protein
VLVIVGSYVEGRGRVAVVGSNVSKEDAAEMLALALGVEPAYTTIA